MTAGQLWVLIGLGIFHGANPGMGWLLAVSRGLQERSRAALLWSLPAISGGHAASIALVAVLVTVTGSLSASLWFTVAGGAAVVLAGLWMLLSHRHFRWRDMRMSLWQLAAWSFLMASLHGAGLMMLPVLSGHLVDGSTAGGGQHEHGAPVPADTGSAAGPDPSRAASADTWEVFDATLAGVAATGVHTLAMFAAAGVIALISYDFLGVHALRLRWVTMDRIWAFVLIAGGVFVLWKAAA